MITERDMDIEEVRADVIFKELWSEFHESYMGRRLGYGELQGQERGDAIGNREEQRDIPRGAGIGEPTDIQP